MCLAFLPAGLAISSGLARVNGCPGGALGFLMLSKITREFPLASFRGEFFVAMSNPAVNGMGGFGMRAMLAPCLPAVNKLLKNQERPLNGLSGVRS